ncbi:MAG: CoA transferase [Candidatus Rokubacteria bacterium]|nr:CoA transferase [Candidatus Rokubacteria bacterium]
MGPLTGLRVVEVGELVSAPYAAKCFADLGAEVVKVEPPTGEWARRHGPFLNDAPHLERSGLFLLLNTNKLGIALDLGREAGRGILDRLLVEADLLIENLHPDDARPLGLDPDAVGRRFPRLVHVSISCFGHRGPWRSWRGHALHAGAAGGASVVIGEPGRAPLPFPASQPDYQGGINGACGAMLALFARQKTGRGQHVDVATTEAMAFYGGITSPLYTETGLPWRRSGHRASGSGGFYPYAILPTRDGYFCLITRSGHPWKRFLEALGNPTWTRDARYRDRAAMGREYPDEVDALLVPYLRERTSAELQELCRRHAIPFAPVRTTEEVARCPQLAARDFFVQIARAEVGALTYPGAPWKFSKTPWRLLRPAPLLGEHTDLVLGRLGVSPTELASLRREGIIA